MDGYVLTCQVQPLPGEQCPQDQAVWVSTFDATYSHIRDVLFAAPSPQDIRTVIMITIAVSVALCLPLFLGRLIDVVWTAGNK